MTWEQLKDAYEMRIAKLVPQSHRIAVRGLVVLEENLKQTFPEAIENPLLLTKMDWSQTTAITNHAKFPHSAYDAFRRVLSTLRTMPDPSKLTGDMTADQHIFAKKDIVFCAVVWLKTEGWETRELLQIAADLTDLITAERGGKKFVGMAIGSVKLNKHGRGNEEFKNLHSFKTRLSRVLLTLLDEMNKGENVIPAIFIADDSPTHELAMMYAKHIKKTGIKIYLMKSVNLIEEV